MIREFHINTVLGYGKSGVSDVMRQPFPGSAYDAAKNFVGLYYPDCLGCVCPAREYPPECRTNADSEELWNVWRVEAHSQERCVTIWIKERVA